MLNIFITNLSKYNEGYLIGEWANLPMEENELNELCKKILGNDEELFITDYENDYGLNISEFDSIPRLNKIAEELEPLNDEQKKVYAVLRENFIEHDEALRKVLNGEYWTIKANSLLELGFALEDLDFIDIPARIARYFDYEAYARDFLLNTSHYQEDDLYIFEN